MELDITEVFNKIVGEPQLYSASQFELGPDAGKITWQAANTFSNDTLLLNTDEKQEAAIGFFAGFGAWSDDELRVMSRQELNALLVQFIAGDIRESVSLQDDPIDWDEYEAECQQGTVAGYLFYSEGKVYYTLEG